MNLRSVLMFLGSLVGSVGGLGYWYVSSGVSGNHETGSNLVSAILYGLFIGIFVADLLSQGITTKKQG